MPRKPKLGQYIRAQIAKNGQTVSDLARVLECAPQTLNSWLQRNRFPPEHLHRVVAAVGLDVKSIESRFSFQSTVRSHALRVSALATSGRLEGEAILGETLQAARPHDVVVVLCAGDITTLPREWDSVWTQPALAVEIREALARGVVLFYGFPDLPGSGPGTASLLSSRDDVFRRGRAFADLLRLDDPSRGRLLIGCVAALPLFSVGQRLELVLGERTTSRALLFVGWSSPPWSDAMPEALAHGIARLLAARLASDDAENVGAVPLQDGFAVGNVAVLRDALRQWAAG